MKAYVIADIDVKDPEHYPEYTSRVLGTLDKYGGRFIVRGGAVEVLEGTWQPQRIVIIEFPDLESITRWYTSQEYSPLIKIRQKYTEGSLLAVQGV